MYPFSIVTPYSENSDKNCIIIGDYNAQIADRQVIEDLVHEDLVLNNIC